VKRKIFSILFALVLVLSMSLVAAVPVAAATITVDDSGGADYTTIQAAINAASADDTIIVAAGTYNEEITINKSLTLNGAQSGVDACGRTGSESIIAATSGNVITLNTADVAVDGFTISGSGADNLVFADHADRFVFQNNILNGTAANGVWFGTTSSDVTIHQNEFVGTSISGYLLFFDGGGDVFSNLTISNNCLYDGEVFAGAKNFGSYDMSMTGNTFDGTNVNLSSAFEESTIDANMFQGNTYTNLQVGLRNSHISRNIFGDTGPSPRAGYPSYAMMLWGDQYGLTPSENVFVTNNFFYFNDVSAPDELAHGLRILAGIDATTIDVFDNSFVDGGAQMGALGLANQGTGIADASGNWWESDVPAAVRAKANGGVDVDYTPWLANGTDTKSDPGFQGDFSELWVDDDSLQTGPTGRIQEGVSLVTGSKVNVAAGTYAENVVIPAGKDGLQIIGHSNLDTFLNIGSGIGFDTYSAVTITGFDIYGSGRGSGKALVIRKGASGTSSDPGVFAGNIVHDCNYGASAAGDYGVEWWNIVDNNFYEIRIPCLMENYQHWKFIGNTCADYKEGVTMGWADTSHHVEIKDNQFLNDGNAGDELAAIVIGSAATHIQVTGNDISNSIVGVLIKQKDTTVPDLTDVGIHFNNIVGNTEGVKSEQAIVDVDATCNWWGHASGPGGVVGPGSGDAVSEHVIFVPWLLTEDGPCLGGLPPLVLKNHAKDELDSIYPTEDKKVDKGLEKAIKHLDKSMDVDLWEDDAHLEVKHGKKVFEEEKKAVHELMKIVKDAGAFAGDAQTAIDALVSADETLAQTAIDDAIAGGGDAKKIAKAEKEMTKAEEELDKGRCDKAIDHFKKAWEHAQKAMGKAPVE